VCTCTNKFKTFPPLKTFLDSFRETVHNSPTAAALTFLSDGELVSTRYSYQELDERARCIAGWLIENVGFQQRVMLVFPPGTDFVVGFLGCLYAGVIAVPVYPPRRRGTLETLAKIARDSGASAVLGVEDTITDLAHAIAKGESFPPIRLQAVELLTDSSAWQEPYLHGNDLAFLQYTSGSTGAPKGVCVSHRNLAHNQLTIQHIFRHDADRVVMAGWLPMYHDMGLVGNLLHPLSVAGELVFMPPLAFLQSPIRWLRMISDHQATISGGPNFAFELCANRTTPAERELLDLALWQVAFNGAEPIRFDSMQAFQRTFEPHGFRPQSLCPCFGMAETTLMVTGSRSTETWQALSVDPAALRDGRIVPVDPFVSSPYVTPGDGDEPAVAPQVLVGSGRPVDDPAIAMEVRIVDPESRVEAAPRCIGEIWIAGGSVAKGYWEQPELSAETFENELVSRDVTAAQRTGSTQDRLPKPKYLRTGDLGFLHDGELYVTGRIKDLIIINGENHYPQDIEAIIGACHSDLAIGNGVAFAVYEDGNERVYVAHEVARQAWRSFDLTNIVTAAYMALWESKQLSLDGLLLVRPGGIPKTTSGKLRRRQTAELFKSGGLELLADWQRHRDGAPLVRKSRTESVLTQSAEALTERVTADEDRQIQELRNWLVVRVSQLADVQADQVLTDQPLALLGLNSLTIVRIAGDLASKLDRLLPPTLAYDHPSIDALAYFLITGKSHSGRGRTSSSAQPLTVEEPIAVVGLGCRFPGSDSADAFYASLLGGICSTGLPPTGRFPLSQQDGSWQRPPGGYLKQIDQFDPLFFGISPREAEEMDPQQRLILEVCWETLEHAAIPLEKLQSQPTGVFIGVSGNEYSRAMLHDNVAVSGHTATGNSQALIANRLSYLLDLRGPSMVVDTACSSSLVAVHLAIMNLMRGECDLAIAGGVSLQCAGDITRALQAAGMLSPIGVSRTFADGADGFVRGEGCGAVLLKRLTDAQRDGDQIFCVLKGSAVNQDGRSNGLTAPNGPAQTDVIRQALRRASLQPDDIDYIEAHGTGTELGDPIEMGAIAEVFAPRKSTLQVGSVKTNIGHLEGAAGIAGLIKTCLALHHQVIPPHLHFDRPSPHIQWKPLIQVADQASPWPKRADRIRRAGVSSFGFGGTNAHLILEETPQPPATVFPTDHSSTPTTNARRYHWIKLSAKNETALHQLAGLYADALEREPLANAGVNELVNAANLGKSDWNHRAAIGFSSRSELIERLRRLANEAAANTPSNPLVNSDSADLLCGTTTDPIHRSWSFPAADDRGSLAITAEVAQELANEHPGFAKLWDEVTPAIRPSNDPRLIACGLQIATAAWFRQLGLQPAVVQAQSTGCLAAAVAAGLINLTNAMRLATQCFSPKSTPAADAANADAALATAQPICPLHLGAPVPQTLDQWRQLLTSSGDPLAIEPDSISFAIKPSLASESLGVLPAFGQPGSAATAIARTLMTLYVGGAKLNWQQLQGTQQRTLSLPTYPFQRQRCWYRSGAPAAQPSVAALAQPAPAHAAPTSLLGQRLDLASDAIVFETDLSNFRELADHRLGEQSVFPAAGYLELASAAALAIEPTNPRSNRLAVIDLKLVRALNWHADQSTRVQFVCQTTAGDSESPQYDCRILSRQPDGWQLHATCGLAVATPLESSHDSAPPVPIVASPPEQTHVSALTLSPAEQYARFDRVGLRYTGVFHCLSELQVASGCVRGTVAIDPTAAPSPYQLHPALLDGCLQAIAAFMTDQDELWLPISVDAYQVASDSLVDRNQPLLELRFAITELPPTSDRLRQFNLRITDAKQHTIATIQNLTVQKTKISASHTAAASPAENQPAERSVDSLTYVETWVQQQRTHESTPPPAVAAHEISEASRLVRDQLTQQTGYADDRPWRICLDQVALKWTINALVEVLGKQHSGDTFKRKELVSQAAIAPNKQPLFWRLLEMLSESGYLTPTEYGWVVQREISSTNAAEETNHLIKHHPRLAPELRLIKRCGQRLADALRGDVDPLQLLFSDKSSGSAVDVYTQSSGAKVLNGLLAEATAKLVEQLPPGRSLRVLEIGGGTAATTREIFKRVDSGRLNYTFTDIARAFLTAADDHFGHHPQFQSARLDIEQAPESQAFQLHSYDVIVAANVLHATADLDRTIAHVSSLLAPGGTLLLLEGARRVRWMDITFGLTDGWWRYDKRDPDRRYALITPDQWRQRLHGQSFADFDVLTPSEGEADDAENVLIVATAAVGSADASTTTAIHTASDYLIIASDPTPGKILCNSMHDRGIVSHLRLLGDWGRDHIDTQISQIITSFPQVSHFVYVGTSLSAVDQQQLPEIATQGKQLVQDLTATLRGLLRHRNGHAEQSQIASFTLVTRGMYRLHDDSVTLPGLGDGPLVGVIRSLALERPEIRCRVIDFPDGGDCDWDTHHGEHLVDELLTPGPEPEVAIRDGKRYVRRLAQFPTYDHAATRQALRIGSRGTLESLHLEYEPRRDLGHDEIEIEIRATGLNFRDVLNALGRYPDDVPLGAECAGTIIAVGKQVTDFDIGDHVIAIAPDCFATTVMTPAVTAVPLPKDWSFVDGASISVAYLTAAYALETIAKIQPGQRVLIHAAAGGVGLAAVSICQSMGAEVFATSSVAKQAFLNGLGISEVANSRVAGFAESIRTATNGGGVDIVLNLLDESFLAENLSILKPSGHYVDITKPSAGIANRVAELRADINYQCFDLADCLRHDPISMRQQWQSIVDRIAADELNLIPTTCFPIGSATKAFRELQRATVVGKIVVQQPTLPPAVRGATAVRIREDRAYVIVGGLGDLGMLTAAALLKQGAGLVALISRRELDHHHQTRLDNLSVDRNRLTCLRLDASDRSQLDQALQQIRQQLPIGGVIHSAGVLADDMLDNQTADTVAVVMDSKATVAWHLHELTLTDPIDLFSLYSSVASTLGAPGQSNHSAANSFLDALANYRLARSQPVTSINWGPWSGVGEAARRGASSRSDLRGIGLIEPATGEKLIARFLTLSCVRLLLSPLSVESMPPRLREMPLFEEIRETARNPSFGCLSGGRALMAVTPGEGETAVSAEISSILKQVLGIDDDVQLSSEIPFSDLGLDSLTGIEFIDALNRKWAIKLATSASYDYPSVSAMTRYLTPLLYPPPTPECDLPESTKSSVAAETALASVIALDHPGDSGAESSSTAGTLDDSTGANDIEDGLADLIAELNQWKS